MRRFLLATCTLLLLVAPLSNPVFAQGEQGDPPPPEAPPADDMPAAPETPSDDGLPPEPPKPPPPSDAALKTSDSDTSAMPESLTLKKRGAESWKDIVVLPRKIFLKRRRVELAPFIGTTVNDNLIQHTAIGGELNYYITDILSVGATGMFYLDNVLDQEFFTRYHFALVPTLNRYQYTATVNMAYVPIYAKFSLFNYWILQYEFFVTGGVGITGTEIIPRDAQDEVFNNIALTFPVGIGARLFVNKWLAVQLAIRDYMMLDKFEQPGRKPNTKASVAKSQAESRFVNNVIVNLGVSFFFPLDFQYTTFR